MFNHAPDGYVCPFCQLIAGHEDEAANRHDVVYRDDVVLAKIAPKWWVDNPGSVLVVPTAHYENIYDTPDAVLAAVHVVVKRVAIAIRSSYGCEGISLKQHNEPTGDQDVWHLHVQVLPRYPGDGESLAADRTLLADAAARRPYADRLRRQL